MNSWRRHLRTAAWLALAGLTGAAQAITFEQVQRIKAQEAIPRWKVEALRTQALRATPPDADTASLWRALDAQTDPQVGKAPLEQVAVARNEDELLTHASWLRWRILSEKADARFSFVYAAQLNRMRDEQGDFDQEAMVFYFQAKLALTLDGMRCSDRSKAEHLVTWYAQQDDLQALAQKSSRMRAAEKSAAILEAIAIEEMLGERPPMGWLCPRRGADDNSGPARYLSDAEWRKYRSDQLQQLTRNAARDL